MRAHGWKLLLITFLITIIFLWIVKAPIMASYLTEELGTEVTMRNISIWPDQTTISHFRISNPDAFRMQTALEAKKTTIEYRFDNLLAKPTEIDSIVLDGVTLNIVILNDSATDNNWAAIGAQMPKKKRGGEVIIHKFIVRNLTVITEGKGAKKLRIAGTQHFDQLEFSEINSKDGFPTKELVSQIFQGAGILKYLENFLNPTQRIKDTLNPFNLFGQKKDPQLPKGL
jgi:uncharacterized protein involved in outer membrane biogenesis